MPSGAAPLQRGEERIHTAPVGSTGATQGDDLGRIEPVGAAGGGTAGAARQAATPIPHGRLAAAAAGASAGAASGGGEEVAGGGAVAQPTAAGGRQNWPTDSGDGAHAQRWSAMDDQSWEASGA